MYRYRYSVELLDINYCYSIQGSGVGGLTHNTVLVGWPTGWRHDTDEKSYKVFLDTLRCINNGQYAALIAKGVEQFPENTDKLMGSIDIWWIVRILYVNQSSFSSSTCHKIYSNQ